MFVIAGVTGNTGRVAAATLLAHHQPVRVLVRDEGKAAPWKEKGAEAVAVSLGDAAGLARALEGAAGAYLLIPPQYAEEDLVSVQRSVADAIAEAVRSSGVAHVVLLSSLGAQHSEGTGAVRALHYAERVIGNAAKNITIVRAAYFLENWIPVLGEAKQKGVLLSFLTPGRPLPMIATRDIGRCATDALLDPARGKRVIELVGPAEWTPEDVAAAVGKASGREVRVQGLPLEAVVPAFAATGISQGSARLFEEMYRGLNGGHLSREGGDALLRFGTLTPGEVLGPLARPPAAPGKTPPRNVSG
jgi:uncharacterized protein YbjT (DUF2867 family)